MRIRNQLGILLLPRSLHKHQVRAQIVKEWSNLTAPERMERRLEMMKGQRRKMTNHLAAVKTFYSVLTPEQQKIFNDNFGRGGHRHRPGF